MLNQPVATCMHLLFVPRHGLFAIWRYTVPLVVTTNFTMKKYVDQPPMLLNMLFFWELNLSYVYFHAAH